MITAKIFNREIFIFNIFLTSYGKGLFLNIDVQIDVVHHLLFLNAIINYKIHILSILSPLLLQNLPFR